VFFCSDLSAFSRSGAGEVSYLHHVYDKSSNSIIATIYKVGLRR
jgi:hypothetical protein